MSHALTLEDGLHICYYITQGEKRSQPQALRAVSYTHLDVYKRQQFIRWHQTGPWREFLRYVRGRRSEVGAGDGKALWKQSGMRCVKVRPSWKQHGYKR